MNKKVLILFTGDGKGKTTAAVGQALRYAGAGKKVLFVQFLKDNTSSEVVMLKKVGITYMCAPVGVMPIDLSSPMVREFTIKLLKDSLKKVKEEKFDAVVYDELAYWLSKNDGEREYIEEVIKKCLKSCDVVITGRNAPEWLMDIADLVTEMKKIKHYFDEGVRAERGREI